MERIIGLGDMIVSNNRDDILKTFSLASCVGVTVYSKRNKVAGMAHIVLPNNTNCYENNAKPAYYALTGVPRLIEQMIKDYDCLQGELMIKLFGGSDSRNENDIFKVGQRNLLAIQDALKSMKLHYHLVDTGGYFSRTIEMEVFSGGIRVTRLPLTRI